MRLDNHSQELSPGRLFIHGQLNDPMTGGPLYCRILSFDAAWVEYEPIYHREDGSERLGSPRRLPIEGFLEETFGGWYEGTWPPPAIVRGARQGLPVPMDPGERSEEHTSELQSRGHLVCRLLLDKHARRRPTRGPWDLRRRDPRAEGG